MKILFINSVCGVGSTGKICVDIVESLLKNGVECKIAYGRGKVPKKYDKYAYKIGSNFGIKINAIKARLFDNEGFNAKVHTKNFIKWIKAYNPDVIHLHNLHGYYINVKLLFDYLKKEFKGKVFWTLHDCWAFTGHCAYFDLINCTKWETGCNHCQILKNYPKSFYDNSKKNWSLKKNTFNGVKNLTIVTPSVWLSDLVKKSFLREYSVEIINNGIDLSVIKPTNGNFREKYDILNKKIILGVANVWEDRKGIDVFCRLSKELGEDYQIVLVGTDNSVDKLLPKNVISIHRTSNQKELAEIYTSANVFVNPTREENYPTVNLESIACGTPVITFRTGGSPECINNKTGIVVEKNDYDGLKNAIKNVCEDKLFNREECVMQAKLFDKKNMIRKYTELFEREV